MRLLAVFALLAAIVAVPAFAAPPHAKVLCAPACDTTIARLRAKIAAAKSALR
jgi:hypothetical protein